jgi:hypothetical protein
MTGTSATVTGFSFCGPSPKKPTSIRENRIAQNERIDSGRQTVWGWAHARDCSSPTSWSKRTMRTGAFSARSNGRGVRNQFDFDDPSLMRVINDYWRKEGERFNFLGMWATKKV